MEARLGAKAFTQQCRQVAIDLDRVERPRAAHQPLGQRAAARADFHQRLRGLGIDVANDAFQHATVVQEVLTEAFAREGHVGRVRTNSTARRVAATRLPASARPVPARSSAVPWSTEVRTMGNPNVTLMACPNPECLSTGRP